MKVSELAAELGVPASAVIEQCQRFSIDATWAGAELSATDLVVLRAEFAEADGGADPLPPTAVGSIPHLIDEVTPEPEPADPMPSASAPGGGPMLAGAGLPSEPAPTGVDPSSGPRRVAPRQPPERRQVDRSVSASAIWLGIGIVALAASNLFAVPAAVAALWLFAAVALAFSLFHAVRAYRHITTHPERLRGLWITAGLALVAVVAGGALALGVSVAVGDEPAADAPLGVGDLSSVQEARWGYVRVTRIAGNGWKRPAKYEGTCWLVERKEEPTEGRVETHMDATNCAQDHTLEVVKVFSWNTDADAPYPGVPAIVAEVAERCQPIVDDVAGTKAAKGLTLQLGAQYPTEEGWADGDHDIACVIVHQEADGRLVE